MGENAESSSQAFLMGHYLTSTTGIHFVSAFFGIKFANLAEVKNNRPNLPKKATS